MPKITECIRGLAWHTEGFFADTFTMMNVEVFVAVCLILFAIFVYQRKKKPAIKGTSQIPGPKPANDLEGNLDEIKSCGNLHQFLKKYHRRYGPIIAFWSGPKMWISIASSNLFQEHASEFDRPPETFQGFVPIVGKDHVMSANGDEGRQRHSAYSKSLNPSSIKKFYTLFNRLGKEIVGKWLMWPEDKHILVQEGSFHLAIKSTLEAMYGEEFENNELVMKVKAAYDYCWDETERYMIGDVPEPGSSREAAFKCTKKTLDNLILEQLSNRRKVVHLEEKKLPIDVVLELHLTESTTISDALTLFIAGFHTTGTLLTWCIYFLATHPEVQNKVREEVLSVLGSSDQMTPDMGAKMKYLLQVLKETLRVTTIVTYTTRVHHSDMVLGGYIVPAEMPVVHAFGVCFHDETVFPHPLKFDPDRFSPANEKLLPPLVFEPFGFGGKRKCPGYNFALAEATVYLSLLLRFFKIELAFDQVAEPKYGLLTRPKDDIWVIARKI